MTAKLLHLTGRVGPVAIVVSHVTAVAADPGERATSGAPLLTLVVSTGDSHCRVAEDYGTVVGMLEEALGEPREVVPRTMGTAPIILATVSATVRRGPREDGRYYWQARPTKGGDRKTAWAGWATRDEAVALLEVSNG